MFKNIYAFQDQVFLVFNPVA